MYIRTQRALAVGVSAGSINIPLATIDEKTMASYAFTTPLFVYCEKGTRSAIAANKLNLLGFIEVYDMGGIQDMF